jgi:hypothetical protein
MPPWAKLICCTMHPAFGIGSSTQPTRGRGCLVAAIEVVRIADLVLDERLRCRVDQFAIAATANRIKEHFEENEGWGDIEPVLVARLTTDSDGLAEPNQFTKKVESKHVISAGSTVLIGGYTRITVAQQCGLTEAPAIIKSCSWSDALRLAWQQNSRHGTPRSEKDMRFILDCIHSDPAYRKLSDRQIASFAGCSRATVNRYRDLFDKKHLPSHVEPTPEGAPAAKLYRDAWGREITACLVEQFRCVETARAKADRLRKLAGEFVSLKYGNENSRYVKEPGMTLIDVRDLSADLYAAADKVEAHLPFIVCPACDGEGEIEHDDTQICCEQCKGNGYLLRAAADSLPPEYEREARKARHS